MTRSFAGNRFHVLLLAPGLLAATVAAAQSDPSLFDTVLDVPPDVAPLTIGSETQLNVLPGGELTASAYSFGALDGSSHNVEVNVLGGAIRGAAVVSAGAELLVGADSEVRQISVNDGGRVVFDGGTLTNGLQVFDGGELTISAGFFTGEIVARPGSQVEFIGNEFRVNGELVDDPVVSLADAFYFSWTGADGEGYSLSTRESFMDLRLGEVSLTRVDVPPTDPTPMVVDTPLLLPPGIRAGEVLELRDGGALPNDVVALPGTSWDVVGGSMGGGFFAFPGSTVRISGGTIEPVFTAPDGVVEIVGGEFYLDGLPFDADQYASRSATGVFTGILENGDFIRLGSGASFLGETELTRVSVPPPASELVVVDSRAPDALRPGQTLILRDGGQLPDGFYAVASDIRVEGGAGPVELIRSSLTLVEGGGDVTVNATIDSAIRVQGGRAQVSLQSGSEATIEAGEVSRLEVGAGSSATIDGGSIDVVTWRRGRREAGGTILVRGGEIATLFARGRLGSQVAAETIVIDGGRVESTEITEGGKLDLRDGEVGEVFTGGGRVGRGPPSLVNLFGGNVDEVNVFSGSIVNAVGVLPSSLTVNSRGVVNIRGGAPESPAGFDSLTAWTGSEINLFGREFLLDGEPIEGLLTNEPVVIAPADGLLTARLVDGSQLQIPLSTEQEIPNGLGAGVRLTITLVPEPTAALLAVAPLSIATLRRRRLPR